MSDIDNKIEQCKQDLAALNNELKKLEKEREHRNTIWAGGQVFETPEGDRRFIIYLTHADIEHMADISRANKKSVYVSVQGGGTIAGYHHDSKSLIAIGNLKRLGPIVFNYLGPELSNCEK